MYKIDVKAVERAAFGRWAEIYSALAPQLRDKLEQPLKHGACPIHGGTDGFRFFKDFRDRGGCICNTCGSFDGLHLLMKINGWSFYQCLKRVSEFLVLPTGAQEGDVASWEGEVLSIGYAEGLHGRAFRIDLLVDTGKRAFWGKDLERAAMAAHIQLGDFIRVTKLGKRQVRFKGQTFTKTLWAVTKVTTAKEREEKAKAELNEAARKVESIRKVWLNAKDVCVADPAQKPLLTYLNRRGILPASIEDLKGSIRFSPNEPYFGMQGRLVGRFPCMVSAVRNTQGDIVTLHRTYLNPNGTQVRFGSAKKLMQVPNGLSINGSGVQFGQVTKDGIVCVSEGIETALSVRKATGFAAVAAISANGLTAFQIPQGTKCVFIYADKDKSEVGQKAAFKLRDRLIEEGVPAVICLPRQDLNEGQKGVDWNDVLVNEGVEGFPVRKL